MPEHRRNLTERASGSVSRIQTGSDTLSRLNSGKDNFSTQLRNQTLGIDQVKPPFQPVETPSGFDDFKTGLGVIGGGLADALAEINQRNPVPFEILSQDTTPPFAGFDSFVRPANEFDFDRYAYEKTINPNPFDIIRESQGSGIGISDFDAIERRGDDDREIRRKTQRGVLEDTLQRYQARQYTPYAAQIDRLRGSYNDTLNRLQDELGQYKGAVGNTNKAYSDYANDADAILKEAASVTAEALGESAVTELVAASYEEFGGAMAETLARIDGNGNEALAKAMGEEVRYNEEVLSDGLRSRLISQEELQGLASNQAQALANMSWKDNLYQAEKTRYQLQIELQAKINDQQQRIVDTRREMDRQIQGVRDSYKAENLTTAQIWQRAMKDLGANAQLNDVQVQDLIDNWAAIMQDGDAAGNFQAFKGYNQLLENYDVLAVYGLAEQYSALSANNPEAALDALLSNKEMSEETLKILSDLGMVFDPNIDLAAEYAKRRTSKDLTLDLWDQWQTLQSDPDAFSRVDPTTFLGGEVKFNPEGSLAFPVLGFNWGSGGGFGYRKPSGAIHEGVDIGGYRGTPIVSPVEGTVVRTKWNDTSGWSIIIRDANGQTHLLAHMNSATPLNVGDVVGAGQYVGEVGNSGNAAGSAPHVHYGIRDSSGVGIDPASWLGTTGAWMVGDPPKDARTTLFGPA